MDDLPTGQLTFLFTDIEGSTRLWERFPEEMTFAHARQADLIAEAVHRFGGKIVRDRGEGDSTFSVFTDPVGALETARSMQIALHAEKWPENTPIRVRAALHSGSAELRGGDYNSTAVNRCARLRGLASGGQTLVSHTVYEVALNCDENPVQFLPLGSHRLKDLLQPEQVFQLVAEGIPSAFPPLRSLDSLPTNLPCQLTSFIGRERECSEVRQLLDSTRLLTITGAGGAGKTRLSLHVAADSLEAFPDGVWLVELAPITEASDLAKTIAQAVGVREEAGRSISDALEASLKSQSLLLVLDNCEHLVAAVAQLAQTLLRSCPALRILATSREPLGIPGEVAWKLPSLGLPPIPSPAEDEHVSATLLECASVRLFAERAGSALPGFEISPQNAIHVATVCRRLDGIPLAIELAAARVRVLPIEQIAERLNDRFRLLTGGSRTALPRQQTLRALIDWSYDLLSERERTLLRRLSVFAGGWTLEAVEEVCRDLDSKLRATVDGEEVLDLLAALVDKSLIIFPVSGTDTRYQFLETVRQYSEERAAESEDPGGLRSRHAGYFLDLAEKAAPHLKGRGHAAWLERLETDYENLRASLRWLSAGRDTAEEHLRCAGALARFWLIKGHYAEGLSHLKLALCRPDTDSLDLRRARAVALNGVGSIAWESSDYDYAASVHQAALSIWEGLGDREGIGISLAGLGSIAITRGEVEASQKFYERALEISRELGDSMREAANLVGLACIAAFEADYELARSIYDEALQKCLRDGNRHTMGIILSNLSGVDVRMKNYESARDLCERALAVHREHGDVPWEAYDLANLAEIQTNLKHLEKAGELHRQAIELNKKLRDRLSIAGNLEGIAYLAVIQENPLVAVRLWAASAALRTLIRAPLFPEIRAEIDEHIASVKSAIGATEFTKAWQEGEAMTLDVALEYADSAGLRAN